MHLHSSRAFQQYQKLDMDDPIMFLIHMVSWPYYLGPTTLIVHDQLMAYPKY
jgi:hypothetical protein